MKRLTLLTVLLACGLLAAGTPLYAQTAGAVTPENWFSGKASLLLLGRDDVDSAKFQEYRIVPKGVSMPVFDLMGSHDGIDYAVVGQNVSQQDQRYQGWANLSWLGVSFDYNSIIHNMGFDGRTLFTQAGQAWAYADAIAAATGKRADACFVHLIAHGCVVSVTKPGV